MIHYNSAHADENMIVQPAAMNDCIVPDAAPVADHRFCLLVSAVNDGAVLYVHRIADPYAVDVSADHGIEPHAAVVAQHYISDDRRIGSKKTAGTGFGMNSVDGQKKCHKQKGIIRKFMLSNL
jgi:hypothetical protein